MPEDATAELDALSPEHQDMIEVVILRMEILRVTKKWDEGTLLGQRALAKHADCGALYLITAYAMRRHAGLAPAKELLLSGEAVLAEDAMFHFNIACYECQLGNLEAAKSRLERAFTLDAKYRRIAREDPDLESLRDWLSHRMRQGPDSGLKVVD